MNYSQLYIHVPFCKGKCIYCDFFSAGHGMADWDAYIGSLLGELRERRDELSWPVHTLYIGGGTPSLMPDSDFRRLINGVRDLTGLDGELAEFTLEANPDDVSEEKCKVWSECGVNRLSLGIQSFNDGELRSIMRRHDSNKAIKAFEILRKYFDNISIDLMFGLPGQDLQTFRESIDRSLELSPEHISAYSLMLEPSTPMTVLNQKGRIKLPEDDEFVEMWQYLSDRLSSHGYIQYEISNYAIPGRESIHNSGYWKGVPYLGLGPSAHSYDGDRVRKSNPPKLKEYMKRFGEERLRHSDVFFEKEILDDEELKEEYIMLGLRMKNGLEIDEYKRRFGNFSAYRLLQLSDRFLLDGTLKLEEGCLRLTKKGIMKSDSLILALSM